MLRAAPRDPHITLAPRADAEDERPSTQTEAANRGEGMAQVSGGRDACTTASPDSRVDQRGTKKPEIHSCAGARTVMKSRPCGCQYSSVSAARRARQSSVRERRPGQRSGMKDWSTSNSDARKSDGGRTRADPAGMLTRPCAGRRRAEQILRLSAATHAPACPGPTEPRATRPPP